MRILLLLIVAVVLFGSCAAGNTDINNCLNDNQAGFWLGLWHGIICPITFIISLVSDSIKMYEVNNNGGWYDFGFLIGAGVLFNRSR